MATLKRLHAAAKVILSDPDALSDIAAYLRQSAESTGELKVTGKLIDGLHHYAAIEGALTELRDSTEHRCT